MTTFRGAYTALVTPFTSDGTSVDYERLELAVNRQSLAGVTGVVPCGTTGESPTLTGDEHREVIARTAALARPLGFTVIAGTGSNCTAEAVAMHRHAAASGADASLQVNPYYNKPSQEGLYRHHSTIADAADIPIVLYNIPGRCGTGLTIETIERLAVHPNIQAIKDATGGLEMAQLTVERTDLAVLSGDDPLTLPLMSIGAVGVVSVLSNIMPDRVAALCEAVHEGRLVEAQSIHESITPIARALLSLDSNPVPVKAAMRMMGLDSGAVRLPLAPMNDASMETLEQVVACQHLVTAD